MIKVKKLKIKESYFLFLMIIHTGRQTLRKKIFKLIIVIYIVNFMNDKIQCPAFKWITLFYIHSII